MYVRWINQPRPSIQDYLMDIEDQPDPVGAPAGRDRRCSIKVVSTGLMITCDALSLHSAARRAVRSVACGCVSLMPESGEPFALLHVHTEYSMLDGAARIKELLAEVKRQGM